MRIDDSGWCLLSVSHHQQSHWQPQHQSDSKYAINSMTSYCTSLYSWSWILHRIQHSMYSDGSESLLFWLIPKLTGWQFSATESDHLRRSLDSQANNLHPRRIVESNTPSWPTKHKVADISLCIRMFGTSFEMGRNYNDSRCSCHVPEKAMANLQKLTPPKLWTNPIRLRKSLKSFKIQDEMRFRFTMALTIFTKLYWY